MQWLLSPPFALSAVLVAATTAALVRLSRNLMRLEETFPELTRLPWIGRFLAVRGGGARQEGGTPKPDEPA